MIHIYIRYKVIGFFYWSLSWSSERVARDEILFFALDLFLLCVFFRFLLL